MQANKMDLDRTFKFLTSTNQNNSNKSLINGFKVNQAKDDASGQSVSDYQIKSIKELNKGGELLSSQEMINYVNQLKHDRDELLNKVDMSSQQNEVKSRMEEKISLNETMIILQDEVGKSLENMNNTSDYIRQDLTNISITNMTNENNLEISQSTLPSDLESLSNPDSYSNDNSILLSNNNKNVTIQTIYDGPIIKTQTASDTLKKIEEENDFNEDQCNKLEENVSEILGINKDDLDKIELIKRVEKTQNDSNKFTSVSEFMSNSEDKKILSSQAIIINQMGGSQSSKPSIIDIKKTDYQTIATNFSSGTPVTDLLKEIKPKRQFNFLSKREIKVLASYLRYNPDEFKFAALKLRLKHHRTTDFAPVYKNGIFIRFAKWEEKLQKDEYFATKKVKVLII